MRKIPQPKLENTVLLKCSTVSGAPGKKKYLMLQQNKYISSQPDPVQGNWPPPLKEQLQQRLLDRYDLQILFRVSRGTIHNWCRRGLLSFTKIGGKKYFDANDVYAMLQKYKQTLVPVNEQKRK